MPPPLSRSSSLCLTLSAACLPSSNHGVHPPPFFVPDTLVPLHSFLRYGSGFANGRRKTVQPTSRYTQCQQMLSRLTVGSTERCPNRSTARDFEGSFSGCRQRLSRVSPTARQRCPRQHHYWGTRADSPSLILPAAMLTCRKTVEAVAVHGAGVVKAWIRGSVALLGEMPCLLVAEL